MKRALLFAFLLFLLAPLVQAENVVSDETYQAVLREYYADEIAHFEGQGTVTECIAFGDKLFVRYAAGVEDLGMKFLNSLSGWLSDNGYSSADIYLDKEWFYTLYAW